MKKNRKKPTDAVKDNNTPTVAFVLHQSKPPYREIKRTTTKKDHFEAALVVTDTLDTNSYGTLFMVLFTPVACETPCKLVKFTISVVAKDKQEVNVERPFNEFFINCQLVSEDRILVTTWKYMILMDIDLH